MSSHESQLRRALEAMQKMRVRLDALENAPREPIAIIGMGCRFPGGANGPDAFWRLLRNGTDAVTGIPSDRWDVEAFYDPSPNVPGKMYTRNGAFLSAVDSFDAAFFGIAPREAASMDPQQRLLLEVAWEALEHAGQAPSRLSGTDTGVFVGISTNDYSQLLATEVEPSQMDAYTGTGTAFNVAAGRLAYFLGLHGPCMAVDTACSSSLVAIHLACQNLRSRKCRTALAGGVNLILSPMSTVYFCQMHALARDGRCKAFDASADGYGRGEGCGVIVLKRLSDALADGDRVLAVIRGSAVNHDGRSSGLTVPNGPAQQAVIREALADARLEGREVTLVEAHGTGTPLGDPIEMGAIAAVLGEGRAEADPLAVGSVKTNLGHLEAAAGVAGVIKLVLSLQNREIPPHLHFTEQSPHIPWADLPITIPTTLRLWNPAASRRIAGVSSFGFSGTNAHLILEEAPAVDAPVGGVDRTSHVLCISARSEQGLQALASRYIQHLDIHRDDSFADFATTANSGRSHFLHRLALQADSAARARGILTEFVDGKAPAALHHGSSKGPREIAFLFTGQGSQYAGMARSLYRTEPVFRRMLDQCDELLRPHLQPRLLSVLFPESGESTPIDQTAYTQSALFALEYSLSELWRSWGVEPSIVLGHSVGEYVAACVAGVFSIEEGLTLIVERARLMQSLPMGGAMASINAGELRVAEAIAPWNGQLAIAAVNSPESTVVSGDGKALDHVLESLSRSRISAQRLTVSHAFHSPLMDPMLDALETAARKVHHRAPALTWVGNVTGDLQRFDAAHMPEYWRKHARMPVRFMDSIQSARRLGAEIFIEIGPSPVLSTLGRKCLPQEDTAVWLQTLKRGADDCKTVLDSVARLYAAGQEIDWVGFDRGYTRRKISIPTYPFERQRYWFDPTSKRDSAPAPSQWLYRIAWDARSRPELNNDLRAGHSTWLVFADAGVPNALSAMLEARGDLVVYADSAEPFQTPEECERLLHRACGSSEFPCRGIIFFGGSGEPWQIDSVSKRCGAVVQVVQALARFKEAYRPRLWLVTRNVQPAGPAPYRISPKDSPFWGLARGISLEHPEIWGGIIDLDEGAFDIPADLLAEIFSSGDDDQVALRSGSRYVPRLSRLTAVKAAAPHFREDGVYLITGGLGAVGSQLTRWMVESGARRLVLTGRTPIADSATAQRLSVLREGNPDAAIEYVQADAGDRVATTELFDSLRSASFPLRGVVHAAGVSASCPLLDLDLDTINSVLRPKVEGAWVLHELTRDMSLDFFILFSSIASVWGSKGLAHYAGGNAFLDALAWYRHGLGLPAMSVNWGPWAGEGMAAGEAGSWLARTGVEPLAPEAALGNLSSLLRSGESQVTVANVRWDRFAPIYRTHRVRPFLDLVSPVSRVDSATEATAKTGLVLRLNEAHGAERHALLAEHLRVQVAHTLGFHASLPFPREQGFFEMGMDSLTAVELRSALEADLGRPLRATVAIDFPTIETLTEHLLQEVRDIGTAVAPATANNSFEDDRIAIIGIGCRFPGNANDPESFWQLLHNGVDAMSEIPSSRWDLESIYDPAPDAVGKMSTRYGAFLDGVDGFDASFFGISPREALSMDPQQRLLLEVAWQAIEHSGHSPVSLARSATGVFIGISGNDYAHLAGNGNPLKADAYFGSGNSLSAAAGRISFALGLQGPSMALDTACSSSLAAVHLACRSLQSGESRLALAGGVNLMLTPQTYVNLSRARMLALDGRCKTFDAAADGYARGEGCGVVVLKRLSEATRDGDRIMAVIRGSAVNQDGHSGGFTVPNGPAQEAVIGQALSTGGVDPSRVDYIEAHGTGTSLGDPIEVQALAAVLGKDRDPAKPVIIGSVKTNIGHLEAASGIAGLIKVALALVHEEIPRHLHFRNPSPHIPWQLLPVRVASETIPWPARPGETRIAGVSSFGFVGTNAHVVLESAPPMLCTAGTGVDRPCHILPVSARDEGALGELAARYARHLELNPLISISDFCHAAGSGRSHFLHRMAIVAGSRDHVGLRRRLLDYKQGEPAEGLYRSDHDRTAPCSIAFLFTGQVAEFAPMVRALYETQPTFRRLLDECDELLRAHMSPPLLSVLLPESGSDAWTNDDVNREPAIFALGYSLAQLWRSWGIEPSVVLGYGVGEYAAACFAEMFSLEDALALIMARARPSRVLQVQYQKPRLPILSSVTGEVLRLNPENVAEYWRRHATEPAPLENSIRTAMKLGCDVFVNIGPTTVTHRRPGNAIWLATMEQDRDVWDTLLDSLARMYVEGAAIDWEAFDRDYPRQKVSLPTYPFQHKRYWPENQEREESVTRNSFAGSEAEHPLLGTKMLLPFGREVRYQARFHRRQPRYLDDHRLFGTVVAPAASHVAMALAAAREIATADTCRVEDFVFPQALVLADDESRQVQFIVSTEDTGSPFQIVSQVGTSADSWIVHASGRLQLGTSLGQFESGEPLDAIRLRCSERWYGDEFYQTFARMGYTLGPSFRWIGPIWRRVGEALCRLEPPQTAGLDTFQGLHPGLLDSCFQLLSCCHHGELSDIGTGDSIYIPFTIAEVRVYRMDRRPVWCHAVLRKTHRPGALEKAGDLHLLDEEGIVVAQVIGLESRQVSRHALSASGRDTTQSRTLPYSIEWRERVAEHSEVLPRAEWLIFDDSRVPGSIGSELVLLLEERGDSCFQVTDRFADVDLAGRSVIFLGGLEPREGSESLTSLQAAQSRVCGSALHILQSLIRSNGVPPPLWIVTQGACLVHDSQIHVDPTHAPLWGLARSALLESPSLRCTTVDLDPDIDARLQARQLFETLTVRGDEGQIAFRRGARLVPRLVPLPFANLLPPPLEKTESNFRLEITHRGVLDNLAYRPSVRLTPGRGEVEIRVRATGLNFRDVLSALDLYPGVIPFGGECAGTIVGLGEGVEGLSVGDAVIALAADSFGAYVTISTNFVVPLPNTLSFDDGATIPAAFLTAHFGLHHLARISPGERVLIHAAAGGVGMAAVAIAQVAGAEIFATAGTPEKREFLRTRGVAHVFDSRTLDFAEAIRSITGDGGIQIVLNSLSGAFIPHSLSLLGQGGRFLEIGKRGIWSVEEMAQVRRDVKYFPYDLEKAGRENPEFLHSVFSEIVSQIADGRLAPLPRRVFGFHNVTQAFRFMAQARHIGKVVITQPEPAVEGAIFAKHATYLITGGTGALGLRLAQWMVEHGAMFIVLVARREPSAQTLSAIHELRSNGARLLVELVDAASLEDMTALFNRMDATFPPLRGVFHAAGSIDDAVLVEQTWERFRNVFAPKVDAAWILHKLTQGRSLDYFVLFSSMASTFGSPGQANYAAANAYLDALAHRRRGEGLPGLSVNWGPWRDSGMTTRIPATHKERQKAQGIGTLDPDQALELLGRLLRNAPPQVAALSMNWDAFLSQQSSGRIPSILSELEFAKPASGKNRDRTRGGELRDLLAQTPEARRKAVLSEHIRSKAAEILGLQPGEPLSPRRPLSEMGLDSLMAVELRNALALALGCTLPATLIFDFPTIDALTAFLSHEDPAAETLARVEALEIDASTFDAEAAMSELSVDDLEDIVSSLNDGRSPGRADLP